MPTDPTPHCPKLSMFTMRDGPVVVGDPDAGLSYAAWLRQNPPAIRRLLGWWPWLRYCWTGKLDVPRSLLPRSYWRELRQSIDTTPLTDAQHQARLDRIRRAMQARDA